MTNELINEKRQSKRYLCDEFFKQITLETNHHTINMTAIDFNKDGIGLFSSDVIPESGNMRVSMRYESPAFNYTFKNMPCSIAHCNLTEVGSHCGLHFNLNSLTLEDSEALKIIEIQLIKSDDPDDRYHLFGDN